MPCLSPLIYLYNYQLHISDSRGERARHGDGLGATSTTLLTRTGISKTPHTVSNRVVMGGSAGLVNMSMSRARYFDHKLCVSFDAIGAFISISVIVMTLRGQLD